jgi:hypothetical protein
MGSLTVREDVVELDQTVAHVECKHVTESAWRGSHARPETRPRVIQSEMFPRDNAIVIS